MPQSSLDPRRVFQPTGNPSATYVERDNGKYEGHLRDGLTTGGLACLIAGPSKTGKSTLYSRVCAAMSLKAIVVRCDDIASPDNMWLRALTALGASYLAKQTTTDGAIDKESGQAKISIKVPFVTAEGGAGGEHTDSSTRGQELQYFQGPPSPSTLVQFWRHGKEVIVIEDTHFLKEDVRRTVYQQCKTLSDNNIPLILVSTAQVATDITYLVKDLAGRCSLTRLPEWNSEDLATIVNKGFAYMRADVTQPAVELIAAESVGLPFLTQMICHRMVKARFVEDGTESGIAAKPFSTEDAVRAMNEYAMDEQHGLSYDRYLRLPCRITSFLPHAGGDYLIRRKRRWARPVPTASRRHRWKDGSADDDLAKDSHGRCFDGREISPLHTLGNPSRVHVSRVPLSENHSRPLAPSG